MKFIIINDINNINIKMYTIDNKIDSDISKLFTTKYKSDIKIECENGTIKAHKLILGLKCEYFALLFSEKYSDDKENTITFDDVKYNIFNEVIRYIYCGKCEFDSFNDMIDCLVLVNRIGYTELENKLLNLIDPMKINKNDNTDMIIKKLLDIKNINEELIYKKITLILNKKIYIEEDSKLQDLLDKINPGGYTSEITFNESYACRFIEKKEYMKWESFKELSKNKNIYFFPNTNFKISPNNLRLESHGTDINGKTILKCGPDNKDWKGHNNTECAFYYKSTYRNSMYTEKALYSKYPFLERYKFDEIFIKILNQDRDFYYLKNDHMLLKIIEDEIMNMEKTKYINY